MVTLVFAGDLEGRNLILRPAAAAQLQLRCKVICKKESAPQGALHEPASDSSPGETTQHQ